MLLKNRYTGSMALIAVFCSLVWALPAQAEMTPDTVYEQALQIEKEIELLRRYYKIVERNPSPPTAADLQPRHSWQRTYVIMVKLNLFRRKHGLVGFSPLTIEPTIDMNDSFTWAQTQRILTEIGIIKQQLNITGEVSPVTPVQGRRQIDVFNLLKQIGYDMDSLNGEALTPSTVYAELRRINEDVNVIMSNTSTADVAFPPARIPDAIPKNSLDAAFALMEELKRMQRQLGMASIDFGPFYKTDNIVPADVFMMVNMCFAELQVIKAKLGLIHAITPPAEYQEGKIPADVVQLMGFLTNKLRQVNVH